MSPTSDPLLLARIGPSPHSTNILAGLRTEHPRLLITGGELMTLLAAAVTNTETAAILHLAFAGLDANGWLGAAT